jgi:hypothetical protein
VDAVPAHGFEQSIAITLPPLAALYLVPVDDGEATPVEIEAERQARDDASRALAAEANATVEAMTRPPRGDDASSSS